LLLTLNISFEKAQVFFSCCVKVKKLIMDCSRIEKQLMFYAEGSLPKNEMDRIGAHLAICQDCQSKYAYIFQFTSLIDGLKNAKPKPFLYTRIKGKMEQSIGAEKRRALVPLVLSSALLVGLLFGTLVGKVTTVEINQPVEAFVLNDLFNDVRLESIEYRILNEQ
jgi:hypothetical protein